MSAGRPKKWNCPDSRRRIGHKAWFHYYGCWPPDGMEVDHIDRNPKNNAKENLRLADRHTNNYNRRGWSKSGVKGVSWCERDFCWVVSIKYAGGLFRKQTRDFNEAVTVARAKRLELHGAFDLQNPPPANLETHPTP